MSHRFGQRIYWGILAICLIGFVATAAPAKADGLILLAQAKPPAPGTPLPPNVTAPARLYIMESIVVALLSAGAIFGVCRASGRT